MRKLRNQSGFVVSIELLFILAFIMMGVILGWSALKNSVVNELSDTAAAIDSLNQTYTFSGFTGHSTGTIGSAWTDFQDFCDETDNFTDQAGTPGRCILISAALPENPDPAP